MHHYSLKTKVYTIVLAILLVSAIAVNYQRYHRDHAKKPLVLAGAKENNYVAVFSKIYAENHWGNGSGPGSNPQNAAQYISLLQQYFDDPRFNTIVDLGCGDWQIMRNVKIPANKTYIGIDVVPSVIEANRAEFSKDNVHFHHITNLEDFVAQNPTGDLLIVKDVIQHWPFSETEFFIANILPKFKYALITNRYTVESDFHNKDMILGPDHSIGLLSQPFNLQHATAILEYDGPEHKQVILYTNPA